MRTHITRLEAGVTAVRNELNDAINVTNAAINDPARDSGARRAAWNRIMDATNDLARLQPTTPQGMTQAEAFPAPGAPIPFTGQGRRLGV